MARFLFSLAVALYVFSFTESVSISKVVEHLSPEDDLDLQKALGENNKDKSVVPRDQTESEATSYVVRKSVDALSPKESLSLVKALASFKQDNSADGFQAIASFHASSPLCPDPSASDRYPCSVHGSGTFLPWLRLYTVQIEDALRRHGALVGIPYLDWTRTGDHLPKFLDDKTYKDPYTGEVFENLWHGASVDFEESHTQKGVKGEVSSKIRPHSRRARLFNQLLYALEQEDYLDFEIHFEITTNTILSQVGGSNEYRNIEYSAYDPIFFIHHSSNDRMWAIWLDLQIYRGYSPNEVNGALEQMNDPLKPFSFGAPYNLNQLTQEYSRPSDTLAYEDHFHYRYDNQELGGMSISALDALIRDRQATDRVFAGEATSYVVRKSVDALSPQESLSLIKALASFRQDNSTDGFQSIVSFHASSPLCPDPSASDRYPCNVHGSDTFLPWHRLYTVQIEDALRRHGALVGIPYLDWTRTSNHLPKFLHDKTYKDPYTGEVFENPWHGASFDFGDSSAENGVKGEFSSKIRPHGRDARLFNQLLFALEQEDYLDFEIQSEVTTNTILSQMGGSNEYARLDYSAFDPFFIIHHSNIDRIWAIWQELQRYRGLSANEVNGALEQMSVPLKPFSFGAPYNLNQLTQDYSQPRDTFAYEDHFHYRYDSLELDRLNIPALDASIQDRQETDRVFADFPLHELGNSADIDFKICNAEEDCFPGGDFTVLVGSAEKTPLFDRVYRYEITDVLEENSLKYDDDYHIQVQIKDINGSIQVGIVIPEPTVTFVPGRHTSASSTG